MGMFDDLIPGGQAGGGMFDDLIPKKTADPKIGQPEDLSFGEKLLQNVTLPSWMDNLRGSAPYRVMQGMADPVVGAVQAAANILPDSTGIPQAVNRGVAQENAQYEQARQAWGSEGFDPARLAGNVLSPTNLLVAAKAPALAATTLGRIGQGAAIGGGTAAMEPVTDATGFWKQKAGQVAGGLLTGAVLTPILGAAGDRVVRRLAAAPDAAVTTAQTDEAINAALKDLGQSIGDIPPNQLATLRAQVNAALQEGQVVDPAALARKADFDALGIQPTTGQLTRDPMQFAREQNLRGVEGVGEPLSARFAQQGTQLQERVAGPAAGARDSFNAGSQILESLKNTDEALRKHVSALYGEARSAAGKDLEIPLAGLAQDYARVVEDFGNKVPDAIRGKFAALGLDPSVPSNRRSVFTLENANALLQNINEHVGNDRATNTALGKLRNAIKDAITSVDASGGPFAPAVKAAAERFRLQDAVPALKAAARGTVAPDDFVRRFVVNGKTNDVRGLSRVLKQSDPTAWQEARAQIADTLRLAAFGENAGPDAPFLASSYMKQIRRLGVDKLGAFFSPQEVQDILTVGRVGTLIKKAPNAAAVSSSNSQIGLINVLAPLNVVGRVARVGKHMVGAVQQDAAVRGALAAQIPTSRVPLSQMQRNYLAYLLASGAAGGGAAAGAVTQ